MVYFWTPGITQTGVFEWTGTGLIRSTQNLALMCHLGIHITVTDISCLPGVGLSTLVTVYRSYNTLLPAELPVLPADGQAGVTSNPEIVQMDLLRSFTGLTSSTFNYEFRNPIGTVAWIGQ